jgi:hypothetical protein
VEWLRFHGCPECWEVKDGQPPEGLKVKVKNRITGEVRVLESWQFTVGMGEIVKKITDRGVEICTVRDPRWPWRKAGEKGPWLKPDLVALAERLKDKNQPIIVESGECVLYGDGESSMAAIYKFKGKNKTKQGKEAKKILRLFHKASR